jgi:hypothetical protein
MGIGMIGPYRDEGAMNAPKTASGRGHIRRHGEIYPRGGAGQTGSAAGSNH